jgi:excisionase family DNA binding protein
MTRLLTVREAAQELRVSTATLYLLVEQRRIEHTRFNSRILFTPEQLAEFVASNAVAPAGGGA